jgi:drug/metabolite transporter (DMT)-like permease
MIGEVAAITAAFCWALSAVLYKKALRKVGYAATNLVRSIFGVLFLLIIVAVSFFVYSAPSLPSNDLVILVFGAIISLGIGDTCYFVGLKKIGVSRAQPISYSYPLFSMFLAATILGETLSFAVLLGTPLIVVGIASITLTKNNNDGAAFAEVLSRRGVVAAMTAAICWSIGFTAYKVALSNNNNANLVSANFVRTAAILPFLIVLVIGSRESKRLGRISKGDVGTLAIAGILALGVGGILLLLSQTLIENSKVVPLSSISPLFGLALASHYSGEKITARIMIGTILIVTGVILITFYS